MAGHCRVDGLITCELTACTLASAPGPMLGNEYRRTFTSYSNNNNNNYKYVVHDS